MEKDRKIHLQLTLLYNESIKNYSISDYKGYIEKCNEMLNIIIDNNYHGFSQSIGVILYNIGVAYLRQNDICQAKKYFLNSINELGVFEKNTANSVYHNLCYIYIKENNFLKALSYANKMLRINPQSKDAKKMLNVIKPNLIV